MPPTHLPHIVYQIVVTTVTIQRVALNILPNPIFCCFFHIHSLPNLYKILYSFTMLYFTLHQMVYFARCFYHPLVSLCINYFQTNVTNQFICYKTFVFLSTKLMRNITYDLCAYEVKAKTTPVSCPEYCHIRIIVIRLGV